MPLHPSLLSCNREELYGKLLRAAAAVDLKSRLMGLKGRAREGRKKKEDCFLLRNPIPILAEKMGQKREEGGGLGVLKREYEGRVVGRERHAFA